MTEETAAAAAGIVKIFEERTPFPDALRVPPPPLVAWRCSGTRRDGRDCHQILAEYATDGPLLLRKRCDKCSTWNTLTR